MKLWLRWLAALGLGVFAHHEAAEVKKTFHPHGPRYLHGILSPAPHDLILEHVEPIFPAIQPPPFPGELYVPATSQQRWDDARFRTASIASTMYYRTP